ncbi:phage holin family protein [Escherichia coli]|nr:phage holin family protein [Escherichia coli]
MYGHRADAFFYRRRDSRHKPLVSWLAWLLMLLYAFAPPQLSVWSPVSNGLAGSVFNLLFCVLVDTRTRERHKIFPLLR